jgi:hypothetical protein
MHGSFCAVQVRNNSAMSTLGIFRDRVQESSAGAAQGDDSVRIQLRLANDQGIITCLSRPFSIDYKRYSFPLRLRAAGCTGGDAGDAGGDADPPVPYDQAQEHSVVCIIRRHMGSIFLKVIPVDPDNPRYLVVNNSRKTIRLWQTRGAEGVVRVEPDEARPFAWDNPDNSKMVSFGIWEGDEEHNREAGVETINFKVAGQDGSLYGGKILWETSVIRRHTRLLEFRDAKDVDTSSGDAGRLGEQPGNGVVCVNLNLAGIALSVVDQQRREVLYGSMQGISAVARITSMTSCLDVSVNKFQVDNQTRLGPPVAAVSPLPESSGPAESFLRARLERNTSVKSMVYWKLVSVKLGKVCIDVYEAWLNLLLSFEALTQLPEEADDDLFDLGMLSFKSNRMRTPDPRPAPCLCRQPAAYCILFARLFLRHLACHASILEAALPAMLPVASPSSFLMIRRVALAHPTAPPPQHFVVVALSHSDHTLSTLGVSRVLMCIHRSGICPHRRTE